MAVNPKNQIYNILVRIKNQPKYTSVSESGPHIYARSKTSDAGMKIVHDPHGADPPDSLSQY